MLIPFENPSTEPMTVEEYETFETLEKALRNKDYSSAVGWVISQRNVLQTDGGAFVSDMKDSVQKTFTTNIRITTGWAFCLFIVKQVKLWIGDLLYLFCRLSYSDVYRI